MEYSRRFVVFLVAWILAEDGESKRKQTNKYIDVFVSSEKRAEI